MSSYHQRIKHPKTGKYELASFIDLGREYEIKFPDGFTIKEKDYPEDTNKELFEELLCNHTQVRYGKSDNINADKWYNEGYSDAFEDLKEQVYQKFGIDLTNLNKWK